MAPAALNGYSFGYTIGKGGNAEVIECKHELTGEIVAIKVASFEQFDSSVERVKNKERVEREIFVAKNLRHRNIMGCYEAHMLDDEAYIVMEKMESFQEHVDKRGGKLHEDEARKYFRQLIYGLEFLHKHLVVHRDIKSRNLLLDETKEYLKIADFGVCNFINADMCLDSFCGTTHYQAPEMTRGEKYSSGVDIFSSGVALFNMLTGKLPSYKYDDEGNSKPVVNFPNSISRGARSLIRRMVRNDEDKRITIPMIKQNAWFQAGSTDPHYEFDDQGGGIDNVILLKTVNIMNCNRNGLIMSLINGTCTNETATYKLLMKKKMLGKVDEEEAVEEAFGAAFKKDKKDKKKKEKKDKKVLGKVDEEEAVEEAFGAAFKKEKDKKDKKMKKEEEEKDKKSNPLKKRKMA